jgi:ketosteroid isomerase-like protein
MSQENLEASRRFVDAFNRRDVEGMIETLDAGIEWRPASTVALGGAASVYRGHSGVHEGLRDLDGSYEGLRIELSKLQEVGERVVGTGEIRVRGRASGAEVRSPFGVVFTFRNGKATYIRSYLDPREALEAAGLPGQAL